MSIPEKRRNAANLKIGGRQRRRLAQSLTQSLLYALLKAFSSQTGFTATCRRLGTAAVGVGGVKHFMVKGNFSHPEAVLLEDPVDWETGMAGLSFSHQKFQS